MKKFCDDWNIILPDEKNDGLCGHLEYKSGSMNEVIAFEEDRMKSKHEFHNISVKKTMILRKCIQERQF